MTEDALECQLSRIVIQEKSDHQYIHLQEKDGTRTFPIVIGIHEAAEINRKLQNFRAPRPMTHDLIGLVLDTVDWQLDRIVITELRDSTFYAMLVLRNGEETRCVDSRPSDAIALAVQDHTPIFVSRQVLDVVAPD